MPRRTRTSRHASTLPLLGLGLVIAIATILTVLAVAAHLEESDAVAGTKAESTSPQGPSLEKDASTPTLDIPQAPQARAPEHTVVQPEPTATPAPSRHVGTAQSSSITVSEATLAHGVDKRQPVEASTRFAVGDAVWAWAKLRNEAAPTAVTFVWHHDGQVRSNATLQVGASPRWRTWARKQLRAGDRGSWTVEIRDEFGSLLERLAFEVQ